MPSNDKGYQEALRLIKEAQQEQRTYLNLFSLDLKSLPPEFSNLTGLTELNLIGTNSPRCHQKSESCRS